MNQIQCVPSWDIDDVDPIPPPPPPPPAPPPPAPPPSTDRTDTSLLDHEVAELTWQNGQLAMHSHGLPRVSSKSNLGSAWREKPSTRASGTLESIVNQAITKPQPTPTFHIGACDNKDAVLVPSCFINTNNQCGGVRGGGGGGGVVSGPIMASISTGMDALVPTANVSNNTLVGSCSAAARVPVGSEWSVSLSGGGRRERRSLKRGIEETFEIGGGDFDLTNGLTSTSFGTSPENTKTVVTLDDYDSVCHTIPQGERMEEEEENRSNKASAKSSMSTKKSRAAAIHNQSERKRRDKINQRMKTLQKLVPNSNKTDKASMLDEVIDYLKQLQAQVEMMNRMSSMTTSMMMPMATMQQLHMSMMSQMGMGMPMPTGIAMGNMDHMNMNMNMNNMGINNPMALARTSSSSTHHHGHGLVGNNGTIFNPSNFMPPPPPLATWDSPSTTAANGVGHGADRLVAHHQAMVSAAADPFTAAFLACQSQPMTMDTYSRMAAMYQQLQQRLQPPGP